ncbi:MAG: dicarboxylate/amino acid:cation symporter [Pseudomonadota bacterium]
MFARWQAIPLWGRVALGFALGLAIGLLLGPQGLLHPLFSDLSAMKLLGDLFIRLIKMLVVPLIFFSLVSGVLAMGDTSRMGRIGAKTLALYLFNMSLATSFGLLFANLFRPGVGVDPSAVAGAAVKVGEAPTLKGILINVIPTNPVAALANGDALQIIFFALVTGFAINTIGEKGAPLRPLFDAGSQTVYKITQWVMEVAPVGVFGLIGWVAGTFGWKALGGLIMLVVTLYVAGIVHMTVLSGLHIGLIARLNIARFFAGIKDAMLVAYSTSTSAGTLPVTMACAERNLGISKPVASFVLPLGATMNMDGTACYLGIVAVFTAQAVGVELSVDQYLIIVVTSVLSAIGAAAVPSASLVLMPIVLSAVGLPIEAVALIAGIDRIMDMMRTVANITGDAIVATVVAKTEGELNRTVFDHRPVV